MLVSYITPTHALPGTPAWEYLLETFKSLVGQRNGCWEWVLCPNNDAGEALREFNKAFADPRVIIRPCPLKTSSIGELKKFACSQANGEIIAELDHDDFLHADCTDELLEAFKDGLVVFAYSNCAEFYYGHPKQNDYKPIIYNHKFGWRYRDTNYAGRIWKECVAYNITPASLRLIYYTPNHIRAWRADAYWAISGHDSKLSVIDDHDLVIRLYLYGKTHHIDKCLYFYRVHGANSWIKYNKEVQSKTKALHSKYMVPLIERWATLQGFRMVDLGGRFSCPSGYESVDIHEPADHVMDLNFDRWGFDDSSIGVVRAKDLLEHLPDTQKTMAEIHRILVPGGFLISETPSTDGRGAFQDPTHVSFWNQNSFWYWTRRQQAQYIDNITVRFQEMFRQTYFPTEWHKENEISYVRFDGAALKDGAPRYPGLIEI